MLPRAPAVDVRGEDDPAIVIDATKQTGDDMPPTRTSSMRPEVAKRELEQNFIAAFLGFISFITLFEIGVWDPARN